MQILIVDDNDDDRLLLQRLIGKHGHHCIEAHDGLEALEIARTRKPDLIISDISMPRMDGFQFLRTAKQDNTLKSIPVIFYSALYTGNREKELAASLGAVSFIEKCHDVHDVWNALKGFLEAGTSPSAPEGEKCLVEEDVEFLKRYNAIVVSKLEEKVRELEKESLKSKQTADLLRESEQKYRTLCKQIDEQLKLTNDDLRVRNNELRISEETLKSLQTILNSMGDGLVVADTSGKFLFINPVAEEILGPGMKEVTAYTWSDYYAFYQPDMKTPYRADELPLSKAIRGESVTMADVFVKHVKEQKYSWASVTARPLLDEHGVLKGGVAIFRDITERKQYAQIIQKQREELQTILDSCPALIFFKDTENNIIRVNKATADLFGVPKEKIEGHSTFEINLREAEKSWRDDKEIIASGMAKTNIVYTTDTPKGIRSFLTDKVPVKDEQGNTIGILGFSIDITKRRQAEERLAEREIQFRTIMETANDAIICLKEPGVIHLWNKKAEEMFGYTRNEANGKDMHALIVPERYREKAYQGLKEFFQTGNGHVIGKTLEVFALRKDGAEFPIEITVSAMQIQGEWLASGIIRDITERKRSEIERERLLHDLNERIKELKTLYGVTSILQKEDKTLSELLQEIVSILPSAWQYPEITVARIRYNDMEFTSPGFSESVWTQKSDFQIKDGESGCIEVFYLKEMPQEAEGPFLAEERHLIDTIAEMLRKYLERKEVEKALQRSESLLRLYFNRMPFGCIVWSLDFHIESWNPAAEKIFGFLQNEVIGKHPYDIIVPNPVKAHADGVWQRLIKGDTTAHTINENTTKDGRTILCEWHNTPVIESDGKVLCVISMVQDITKKRQNERRLAAQHEVTKILAESDTAKEAFPKILQTICEGIEWEYGEIWFVDEQNNVLRCAELWQSPSLNIPEFIAMTRGMALTPSEGLPGKVWVDGKSIWVPDIPLNTGCIRAAVALKEGMHSAFFFPVVGDNRILGVMGFFSCDIKAEEEEEEEEEEGTLRRISAMGRQIGMFLLRRQAEEREKTQIQHLIALRDIDKAIISSLDLHVTIDVFLDRAFHQLNADAIDVLLFDPYMQVLRYAGGRGFSTTQIQHTRIHPGEGLTGTSLLENRPICIPDVNKSNEIILRKELFAQESFAAYYCMPLTAKGQMKGVVEVYYRKPKQHGQEWTDFLETLAGQAAIAIDNATLFKDLRRSNIELLMAYDSTIEGWARALDLRDRETEGHSRRVTELTVQVAIAMGLISEADLIHVRRGALLHDIGKMGIPDGILLKDKPLNEEEWAVMKKHPIYSYNLLSPIAYLHPAIDIPYCHHEKWDGTGYPRGLKGEQIPLAARIFAVVDVWDAMRSDRPYRKGIPVEEVREHIRSLAGTHFDPKVVEVFLRMDVS